MIRLRTAQQNFLKKVEKSRTNGKKKGLLIFPTGLGKSLASFSDALNYVKKYEKRTGKMGKILILAHNHNLLKQLATDFKKLCKNRKIGFMYEVKKEFDAEVIFGNVKTIRNYLHKFRRDEFIYIIVDETHHAMAKTYRTILDYFTPEFLLGMTATPTRTDRQDILPLYDNNIVLEYTEKQAIRKKWLRPYKIVALWDKWCDYGNIDCYRKGGGFYKYEIRQVGKKYLVPERIKGISNVLINGVKEDGFKFKGIGNKKGIYFSPLCIVAKRYCDEFNKAGIKSVYIDGKTPNKKREQIIKDFKQGKYQLLFNVNLIGEGFHIPKVDLVIIDRPTDSYVLWNQQKGRQIFNIEGQKYDTKGLLVDFVGNSKNLFKQYTYNIPRRQLKQNGKNIKELVEKSIGVECEFETEIIENFRKNNIPERTLQDAIKEFKKIYGNNKPTIHKLSRNNSWIYRRFRENNLLKKYCKKTTTTLNEAIHKYNKVYKDKIPSRRELSIEYGWIYNHFKKNDLLDKYCRYSKRKFLKDAILEFKRIYGHNKIPGQQLNKEHHWIWGHFYKNGLLNSYCISKKYQRLNLKDTIKKFKKIYGNNKPTRTELSKKNRTIWVHFQKNNMLGKYCKRKNTKTLQDAIKEFKKIYKNEKPNRTRLLSRNLSIYTHFLRNGLLDKYCLKRYSLIKRISKNQITSIPDYKPINKIPKQKRTYGKDKKSIKFYNENKYKFKPDKEKENIRPKIISQIKSGDNILLLESPELKALKEIQKQNIKPNTIFIPNNREFKALINALNLDNFQFKIIPINTSVEQFIADMEFILKDHNIKSLDYIWLDYQGGFSYYKQDLKYLFNNNLNKFTLILTYNKFDVRKKSLDNYFVEVIKFIKKQTKNYYFEFIDNINYDYKRDMYNIGFKFEKVDSFLQQAINTKPDNLAIEENEEEEAKEKYYYTDNKKKGIPSRMFYKAMIKASTYFFDRTNKGARNITEGITIKDEILPLTYKKEGMHSTWGRQSGMSKAPTKIIRPIFFDWKVKFFIEYNQEQLSAEQIISILNWAGFYIGVGSFRKEKSGNFGMFKVKI